jgi:hypothetical protein
MRQLDAAKARVCGRELRPCCLRGSNGSTYACWWQTHRMYVWAAALPLSAATARVIRSCCACDTLPRSHAQKSHVAPLPVGSSALAALLLAANVCGLVVRAWLNHVCSHVQRLVMLTTVCWLSAATLYLAASCGPTVQRAGAHVTAKIRCRGPVSEGACAATSKTLRSLACEGGWVMLPRVTSAHARATPPPHTH